MRIVKKHYIGTFDFTTKMDIVLKPHIIYRIPIVMLKSINIKLTDSLFRCNLNFFSTNTALHIRNFSTFYSFSINSIFYSFYSIFFK